MRPRKLFWLVSVFTILLPGAAAADDLAAIVRDFDAHTRIQDPVRAGQRGDREALRRWPDNSPAAVIERRARLLHFRERLDALESAELSEADALNRALLDDRVRVAVAGLEFDEERIPFISGDGFYTTADYAALGTTFASEADAEAWLARLAAIPAYYATETANMERGIRTGFTQPRVTVERAIRDVRAQAEQPSAGSPLLAPFDTLPATFPQERRASLRARALKSIDTQVKPAQRELLRFLEHDYRPAARGGIGAASLPDGHAYYAYLVRRHTTTTMTPAEVHALGLAEVARIRAAMGEVIAGTGFEGSFAEFLAFLRSDQRFYVDSVRYGEKASEIAKRADEAVARIVGHLPRLTYGVRPIPAALESSANGYLPGSPEQGIAGMVVFKPWMAEKMPTFGLAAWVLHEGVPGHHLQIALSQEMSELPEFRRADDVTAYVEGWGLYAEKLGEDMGIYRDAYEHFGRLSLEMWRACRLVIDTGMHAMGWTRDQAVACLRDNSALAATEIEFEVDRYIAWPAQALAYKVGEQTLLALRRRAEGRLGAKFDLRRFHDQVLGQGAMPLAVLESQVDRWIDAGGP
ncbi:MAG TPA: DUF885 domain-containing protein [Steroidobacteraceae bacterium]